MKLVKNFVFTVLLASVLAVTTSAGEIGMPSVVGPPPPPGPQGASSSDEGKSAFYSSAETSDYLFYEALEALLAIY